MSYKEVLTYPHTLTHKPAHLLIKKKKNKKKRRREDNCHLVPGDVFQSYPCHRQEVTHNVGQTERYQGFPKGNLSLQDTGSQRGPGPPSLYLQVQ